MPSESPKFSPADEKAFRHDLIQEEFRSALENSHYDVPEDTDAIMALSGTPRGWHTEANKNEDNPEDVARIKFSIEVYKKLAAKKFGKAVSELTESDLANEGLPPLVLNGATEQLPMMERIARSFNFPENKIVLFNCGDHAVANTQTQFTKIAEHPIVGKLKRLAVISSSYHVPRIARTASANLPNDVDFDVLGVPLKDFPFDVYRKVRGEVKRIIEYSAKGDISLQSRTRERIRESEKNIDMAQLADWDIKPSTPLWEKWGEAVPQVAVKHTEKEVQLPIDKFPELKERRSKFVEDGKNFNGPMANVEGIRISPQGIEIETSTARFFDYMASSGYFREIGAIGENPIRPLATQAVLLTPKNEIIFTRRPSHLFDFPNALSEFGGALKPEQTDMTAGIMEILERKLGLRLDKNQLQITGLDRENVSNIFCVFHLVRLTQQQTDQLLERFKAVRRNITTQTLPSERQEKRDKSEVFYKVSAEESLQYMERLFEHRPINSWNPTAYTNVLYALAASKLRSPAEIAELLKKTKESLEREPFKYE